MNILSKILILLTISSFSTFQLEAASKLAGQTIKIGVLTDMSGVFAEGGGSAGVTAVQMAVDDFIATNKPDFKIEVISADHQNKVDIASALAREWFDTGNVDLITELDNSAAVLAVNEVAAQKGKAIIVTAAITDKLTNASCKPYTIHYGYNTQSIADVAVKALTDLGNKTWFLITNNFEAGLTLEAESTQTIKTEGGTILGAIRHPFDTADFSSFLLQAKGSGAQVIALWNGGSGLTNSVKQAREFGIGTTQKIIGVFLISDIHALGLEVSQGIMFAEGFVWNRTPETTEWSRRFLEKAKKIPTMVHAADYSSTRHYLQAVQAADSREASEVVKKMKSTPVNDFFAKNATIREDGLLIHDLYLVEVKKPEESKEPWDYLKIKAVVPGDQAFAPLSHSLCPAVKAAAK